MTKNAETIVISVGGSLIAPKGLDIGFLKGFKSLIVKHVKRGKRFVIITGGGRTSRNYQDAARAVGKLSDLDLDWLGIHGTRMNAHLFSTIFRDYSHWKFIKDPTKRARLDDPVIIAGGWKPGFSTDYDAVILARQFKAKKIINLSNIDYAYDKDPNKHPDAKKLETISWKNFRKLVGNKWHPGLSAPFDPVASKECEKEGMTVYIVNGKDLKNVDDLINKKEFIGTTIV
ncbi:UMP kinase [Candidatus Woesearchaeota archaeon]|nr:UMP kinase [Candidatus Woesearchaeota archaeon]